MNLEQLLAIIHYCKEDDQSWIDMFSVYHECEPLLWSTFIDMLQELKAQGEIEFSVSPCFIWFPEEK